MDKIKEILRNRYSHLHPLIFKRSAEKAKTNGQLFDFLESVGEYPMVWNDKEQKWCSVVDLFQAPKELKDK